LRYWNNDVLSRPHPNLPPHAGEGAKATFPHLW
jgi:hypothetical protein